MKERITYLDHIKAIAIFFVVMGHVIQYWVLPLSYVDNRLWNIIYSFHMALFMMVSGYVFQMGVSVKNTPPRWHWIKKRFRQLMLPFIVWTVISALRSGNIERVFMILVQPDLGLWFIYVLFFISVSYMVGYKISIGMKIPIPIGILIVYLMWILLNIATDGNFGISMITSHFVTYVVGCLLYVCRSKIFPTDKQSICIRLLFAMILFGCLACYVRKDCTEWDAYNLPRWQWLVIIKSSHILAWLSGSLIAFYISMLFDAFFSSQNIYKIGSASMGIYALHFLVIHYLAESLSVGGIGIYGKYLLIVLLSIGLLLISYVLVLIVRQNRLLSYLLLGEKR